MVFHYENPCDREWRFSYLFKEDTVGHTTSAKRYTYLFGSRHHCRTAIDRFSSLADKEQDDKALLDAFSVESLTKEFYRELFDWYQWAIDESTGVTFPNNTETPTDDREQIETKIIRLITRLMFVWFIKQKDLVPDRLFDPEALQSILRDFDPRSRTSGNYYNAILQNLFFATLNRAIIDEEGQKREFAKGKSRDVKTLYRYNELFALTEDEVIALFAEVPFLNGGLFECLDKTRTIDGAAYNYDGFSRNAETFANGRYRHRAFIPNNLFFDPERGLFPILQRYNFTVEESTPQEQQVALDPELLGKVFENLLGVYNPETQETARNQSGSFYTPREIVEYMVDESLIAYLGDTSELRTLFSEDFDPTKIPDSNRKEWAAKLKTVKILDPACGSGAFPMGLLNRIVDLLHKLDLDEDTYRLKLELIENCIYGVDIQSIATQISKLRFFISLICDCEKDPTKPNYGIPTLPNLETKFICADSLIGKKKKEQQLNLFDNEDIDRIKNELLQIRHDHFRADSAAKKKRLRTQDERLREQLAARLSDNLFDREDARQIAEWNPYDQNSVSPFFDPEWMFGLSDGFDIVIGNPPYIPLQNNSGLLAKRYEHCAYMTFARTGDIYCLFYERGLEMLKNNGILCCITSNKWMRAGYGEKIRSFFARQSNPKLLIDFAGIKVFESATVDTNILLCSKEENAKATLCAIMNKTGHKNLSLFVQQQGVRCAFSSSDSWVILSPIEQSIKRKIEAVGTPLKDWDIQINYGIKTGFNDAFIISTEKRDEILANCRTEEERERTAELIRPILRGRDIKRYGYEWADLWIINTHNGIKRKFPRIDVNEYPAIKAHLDQYWDKISKRADRGDTPYNLRNCAYMEDFMRPKVMWKIIGCNINFCYDEKQYICNNAVDIMVGDKSRLIQFVGLMNSKLFDWYLKLTTEAEVQGGGIQLYVTTLEKTLMKLDFSDSLTNTIYQRISGLIDDKVVDDKIFDAYLLTQEERMFILNDKRVTRNRET